MNEDRIGRDEAERILRDAAGGPRPGQDALTAFLASAAAPAADEELAGEEAAVAAFRRARLGPAPRRRPLLARVLTVKAAVALALSATAVGGVALAAGTGTLPGPLGGDPPASHRTTTHSSTPAPGGGAGGSGGAGGVGGTPTSLPSPAASRPTPSPSPGSPGNGHGGDTDKRNGKDNGNRDEGKAKGHDKRAKKSPTPASSSPARPRSGLETPTTTTP
jgi:hypothetical protein